MSDPSSPVHELQATTKQAGQPSLRPLPIDRASASDPESPIHEQPDSGHVFEQQEDDYPLIPEADDDVLLPPPDFRPFFSVVTNPQETESVHPSVYYVFADDADNEHEGHNATTIASIQALTQADDPTREAIDERFILLDIERAIDEEGQR